jgi:hypothetical protein
MTPTPIGSVTRDKGAIKKSIKWKALLVIKD